mgnify:CR=1 FL=1
MKTSDFNYQLPEELIAQTPLERRDGSRLMVLNRETGEIQHKHFYDIIDYLNDNYMYDLSMEEIANYTGRSLATFKRDFAKVSELTPQKWIIKRRLEAAHELIKSGKKKVTEACFDVGFKNLSHFSKVYKETYGYAPSMI